MKTKRSHTHPLYQQKENLALDQISQIKQLMKESYEEFHSVEFLCEQIGVTYHTFRKEFRRHEGICLSRFFQQCRLQKAEQFLNQKDSCIFQVAYKIGFSSDGNFSRWFKKQKGISPTEFREQQLNKG
jgi:AraC-like DNA-binding protein